MNTKINQIEQIFILAAGYGKRLLPLTKNSPKPLIKLKNKPLIDHLIDPLHEINIKKIFINTHYLSEKLTEHLNKRTDYKIFISQERDEILDTGGGIKYALGAKTDQPIYVINCDAMLFDNYIPMLNKLKKSFNQEKMDFLLGISTIDESIGYSGIGDFYLTENNMIKRFDKNQNEKPFVNIGISIMQPKILEQIEKRVFSLNEAWDVSIKNNRCFGIEGNLTWVHTGTKDALKIAENML
ncbi:MAG: nucleotidyltransferase family protein [Alphaproteobacteria bacterium]|jgi:MurNAc alpha-1-phosphate uridylyltransferase|nr:nucleotidyltransferase family protein [Hyphomicrobiales bacterium]|tara:strand:- start:13040 stop:13759 length:720 start_codon:yes stop_codon:yes gene_type:complete